MKIGRAAAVFLVAADAVAQTALVPHAPDFSTERLTPPPGPAVGFQVEDATLGTSFALVSSLATDPLVVRAVRGGQTLSTPVELQATTTLLGAYAWDRYQVGVALPFTLQSGDRLSGLDLNEPGAGERLAAAALGDVRVHGKAQLLVPRLGYGPGIALDVIAALPTGDQSQFTGEGGPIVELRLIGSYRAPRWRLAADLGARLRAKPVRFFNPEVVQGNEVAWGLAGTVDLPLLRRLAPVAVAELAGAWGGDDGPSPVEARLGLRVRVSPRWTVGVGGGLGLGVRDIGAPGARGVVELRFTPSPTDDADGDGIPDALDQCPTEPEDRDGFQDADGCPDPDNDGDGIPDALDKCPNQPEDFDGFQDADGCPDPDNDGDGIPDELDLCPNEPEDRDGFEDADGCPDPDNDGDGVPDEKDKCPSQAEDKDGFEDEDGCADLDDDRDGVPDAEDKCPDAPGFITSPTDLREDGCPHGPPLVEALPDGTLRSGALDDLGGAHLDRGSAPLRPPARQSLAGPPGSARIIVAIARAAHYAGWDDAPGDALVVTIPGDTPGWNPLAERRSEAVARGLIAAGVRARVEARAHPHGVTIVATPEALEAGKHVHRRGAR